MRNDYQVTVGNIGTVYTGHSSQEAWACFKDYQKQANSLVGRASGEPVTFWKDGEPIDTYDPAGKLEPKGAGPW